jgi:hypothetical protein
LPHVPGVLDASVDYTWTGLLQHNLEPPNAYCDYTAYVDACSFVFPSNADTYVDRFLKAPEFMLGGISSRSCLADTAAVHTPNARGKEQRCTISLSRPLKCLL